MLEVCRLYLSLPTIRWGLLCAGLGGDDDPEGSRCNGGSAGYYAHIEFFLEGNGMNFYLAMNSWLSSA
jgi:hypothetical protein